MSFRQSRTTFAFFLCLFLLSSLGGRLCAQAPMGEPPAPTGGLTGLVRDPSGTVVAEASVSVTDGSGASRDTTTNKEGIYEFKELSPGAYTLKAVAKGVEPFTQGNIQIAANQVRQVSVSLTIHVEPEKVQLTGQATNAVRTTVPAGGPTGGLTGLVTDPSGAGIPKATVRLTDASGASYEATSSREGIYEFKALPAGVYTLKAVAKGFALFTQENVQITANQVQQVNISLTIHVEEQKVEVTDETTKVDVDPSNNAGEVVMKGKDLEALSDDPDELQSELQALAGPSAGPNGGQIYIDGFTAGQLPPKASIREIRINQNPFSSEYDKLGYGRVEILTKPGTDQLHGQFSVMGNTAAFNSRNPFAGAGPLPDYNSTHYSGNLGGSLAKKTSFFFNIERRNLNDLSVVNTPYVDPTSLQTATFAGAFSNPRTRTNVSQRFDFQLTPNNTLTARYQYWRNDEQGGGVGGFNLPAVGYNALSGEHTFQLTDTQVLGPRTINETRFQYIHEGINQNPLNTTAAISIQGAFTTGGNTTGVYDDLLNRYELQNVTYVTAGKHSIKYGGRLRASTEDNSSHTKFNGMYVFGSRQQPGCTPTATNNCQITGIEAYQIMLQAIASGDTPSNVANAISKGGGASYYALNSSALGVASADVTWFDGGLFLQDDWRIRPNVTLSTGLRYETQNDLGDHADFAPRVGIAWALGGHGANKPAKTVLRVGFGIFYDRFTSDLVLQQELQNGQVQQQFLVQNPPFFKPDEPQPVPLTTTTQPQVVYQVNPALRTPYVMQAGATVERQLSKYANLSVTYLNSRGVHQFYTNFVTNPRVLPATPQITYQYESGGIFKQNQLIVNSRVQMGARLSLWGYYTLNYANSDTSGAGYIPSIPCGVSNLPAGAACGIDEDYGRASFDVRHRAFVGGSISMPWGLRASPFLVAQSGSPFNITTGEDLYGINAYNTRPTVGSCGSPGVVDTPYGCFNHQAQPGQIGIPINEETGPARFTLNLRFSKTFGFGEKKETAGGSSGPRGGTFGRAPHGGGEHGGAMFGGNPSDNRYNLTFSVNARNVFNNVNASNPIGNLSSPSFGQSTGLVGGPFSSSTANRLIYLQCQFNF
jgi:Carboxypeptidase regulatory-like domain